MPACARPARLAPWLLPVAFTAVASLTSVAHAQAPGDLPPQPYPAPEPAWTLCGCAPVPAPSVMDNRWSVGLSIGSISLSPHDSPDNQTAFAAGELALRFRATPHFEFEVSAGGGREQIDGRDGDLEVTTAALALRYRLNPEGAWNFFVMGGLGAAAIVEHDASDQARHDATRPLAMLGVGLERRFRHLAIQAELRGVALGDPTAPAMTSSQRTDAAAAVDIMPTTPDQRLAGAAFSVGLSYYF